jgi:hypothetical protein
MSKIVRVNDNLVVSRDFFDFLANTNNVICSIILNANTERGISFLSPSNKGDMISYLPDSKFKNDPEFDPFGERVGRVSTKVGRVVSKLLTETQLNGYGVKPSQIEDFVNHYKSWFDKENFEFKIVEGDDIKKWYLDKNYFTPSGNCIGNIWKSCMRYRERQPFLDLYSRNPNVKMLVMLTNVDGVEKVRCRALLWDNVKVGSSQVDVPEDIKVMDRIYSVFDSDVKTFKKWADDNGYIPKWEQNAKSHQYFDIKGQPIKIKCNLQITEKELRYYPYLDTFPFFDVITGTLYNDEYNSHWKYKLVQADGSLERSNDSDEEDD